MYFSLLKIDTKSFPMIHISFQLQKLCFHLHLCNSKKNKAPHRLVLKLMNLIISEEILPETSDTV